VLELSLHFSHEASHVQFGSVRESSISRTDGGTQRVNADEAFPNLLLVIRLAEDEERLVVEKAAATFFESSKNPSSTSTNAIPPTAGEEVHDRQEPIG
jgi:hypothetical protein